MLQKLKRWARRCARDEGVAGVIIAMIISIAAFSALAVFMSNHVGLTRELPRTEASYSNIGLLESAVLLQVNQNATLPCPDTDAVPDGVANTCNSSGTTSGVLPWITLGLGRDDVVDGYGTFYSYVIAATPKDLCVSVGSDYNTSAAREYTGEMISSQELELRTTDQAAGEGRYVPFVIFSHGPNRLGGISVGGTAYSAPASGSEEETNAGATPTVVFSGPRDTGSGTAYFDDIAFAPTNEKLQGVCDNNTPGGTANADLYEPFSGAIDTDKLEISAGGGAPTYTTDASGNGVARLTLTSSYLVSAANFRIATNERPSYISTLWTPDPLNTGAATAGFSIITRADGSPTGDLDDPGITFRFAGGAIDDDANGEPATLSILNDGVALATSASFNLITAETYLLEVYDNGDTAWMRITQQDDPANMVTVAASTTGLDLTGNQRVIFVNGANTVSYIDEVLVGSPMLALETLGTGYAHSPNNADNGTSSGILTLETWVKPRNLPGVGQTATLAAQWNSNNLANSSFRLFMTETGALSLSLGSGTVSIATQALGVSLTTNTWTHIALTYNAGSLAVYKNGVRAASFANVLAGAGIRTPGARFAVGATWDGTNYLSIFDGAVSDVRVWDTARTSANIADWYNHRLPLLNSSADVSGLIVNWRFDLESGGFGASTVVRTPNMPGGTDADGTLAGGAIYTATRNVSFRPLSTDLCGPGLYSVAGNRVGPYRCDFREAASNYSLQASDLGGMVTFYAKAWGGGGGADTAGGASPPNDGGGGGFAGGLFLNEGTDVTITVGDGGTSGTSGVNGADSFADQGPQRVTGHNGVRGTNGGDGNSGTGTTAGTLMNALTDPAVASANRRPGCIPAIAVVGDPCTDTYYSTVGATVTEPGYGADGPLADHAAGQRGAVILFW